MLRVTPKKLNDGNVFLIDDHGSSASAEVWFLYAELLRTCGYRPTVVEWDSNLPTLNVLVAEAARAAEVVSFALGPLPC